MAIILSLDIGTSKLCAMTFCSERLKPLAVQVQPNRSEVPGLEPGRHEQDAARIREDSLALLAAVSKEASSAGDVAGISITGQMHGVLLVDCSLTPRANLMTWQDQRALQAGLDLKQVSEPFRAETGCGLHPGYGGATLAWLARHGALDRGLKTVTIADYLAAVLSGRIATEPTHAASWGIYNLHTGRWQASLITKLGIRPGVLPEIIPTLRAQGFVTDPYRRRLGLTGEVQVAATVGDNQASVLGALGFADDAAVLNLGTGGQISIVRRQAQTVPCMETRPMPFGRFILVGAALCGGWSYAYLMQFFRQTVRAFARVELADQQVYATMNRLAAKAAQRPTAPPQVDTRFAGTRGEPERRGRITGIDTTNLTPGHLALGFLHGMVRELSEMVPRPVLAEVREIAASGNAARENPLVREAVERQFGRACRSSGVHEEAVLGAALGACVGLGFRSEKDIRFHQERAC